MNSIFRMILENFIFRLYDNYTILKEEIPDEDDIALLIRYIKDYIYENDYDSASLNIIGEPSEKYDIIYLFFMIFQGNLSSTNLSDDDEEWCIDFLDTPRDYYHTTETHSIEFYCDPDGYPDKDILTFKDLIKIIKLIENGNT